MRTTSIDPRADHPVVPVECGVWRAPMAVLTAALLSVVLVSSSTAVAQDPALAPTDRPRLLVLEVTGAEEMVSERRTLTTLIGVEVAGLVDYDVVTTQELEKLLTVEKDRQLLGCLDASCLAEVADAMGTERIVFGELGKIGSTFLLTLSLFDSISARATKRVVVKAIAIDEFVDKLPGAIKELTGSLTGSEDASAENAATSGDSDSEGDSDKGDSDKGDAASGDTESSEVKNESGAEEVPAAPGEDDDGGIDILSIGGWSVVGLGGFVAVGGMLYDVLSISSDDKVLNELDLIGPAVVLTGVAIAACGASMALLPGLLEEGDDDS